MLFYSKCICQQKIISEKGYKIKYKGSNYDRKSQLSEILTEPLNPRVGYRDTGMHGLQGYRDRGIEGYTDTGIQGYKDTWIEESRDTEIQGYRDTGIQGYSDTGIQ